jgi:hypothetical protein
MSHTLPLEVIAAKEELERFCSSQGVPGVLLGDEAEIRHASENLPHGLLPFLSIQESSWPDVYALDSSSKPPSVVVWSDHAIVARWDSFEAFLQWTRDAKG